MEDRIDVCKTPTTPGWGYVLAGLSFAAAVVLPLLPGIEWRFWSLKYLAFLCALLVVPPLLIVAQGRLLRGVFLLASVVLFGFLQWACPGTTDSIEMTVLHLVGAQRYLGAIWLSCAIKSALIVGLAILFGRYYCGWICPMGALQEMLYRKKLGLRVPRRVDHFLKHGKYVAALAMFAGLLFSEPWLFSRIEPFKVAFQIQGGFQHPEQGPGFPWGEADSLSMWLGGTGFPWWLVVFLLVVLVLSVFIERPYCRYFSPVGGLLAYLGRFSLLGIRVDPRGCTACGNCAQVCPTDAIRIEDGPSISVSKAECIMCKDCEAVCAAGCLSFSGPIGPRPR